MSYDKSIKKLLNDINNIENLELMEESIIKNKLKIMIKYLQIIINYDKNEVKQSLILLVHVTSYESELNKWLILTQNIHIILVNMLKQLMQQQQQQQETDSIIIKIFKIFDNLIADTDLCKVISESGIVELILQLLNQENFSNKEKLSKTLPVALCLVKVSILHSLAKNPSSCVYLTKNCDAIDTLFAYRKMFYETNNNYLNEYSFIQVVKADIAATLLYLISDYGLICSTGFHLITEICSMISKINQQSFKNELKFNTIFYFTFQIGEYTTEHTFLINYLSSLLNVYKRVSTGEHILNANRIESLLSDIIRIFELSSDEFQQNICLELLWYWSFHSSFNDQITKNQHLIKLIEYRSFSSNYKTVVDNCKKFLQKIKPFSLSAQTYGI